MMLRLADAKPDRVSQPEEDAGKKRRQDRRRQDAGKRRRQDAGKTEVLARGAGWFGRLCSVNSQPGSGDESFEGPS